MRGKQIYEEFCFPKTYVIGFIHGRLATMEDSLK
jgi:hypothetical protein